MTRSSLTINDLKPEHLSLPMELVVQRPIYSIHPSVAKILGLEVSVGEDKKRVAVKLQDKFEAALLDQAECPATIREIMHCQADFQLSIAAKKGLREDRPNVVDFQWKTANAFPERYTQGWQLCLNTNLLAMQSETVECLETTNWKPWRTNFATEPTAEQKQDAKYELIDVMCFLMNSFMLLGGTPDEFSAMYFAKMGENHNRQATGY